MTTSHADGQLVLGELALPMLFVDVGAVQLVESDWAGHRIPATLALARPFSHVDLVAIMVRLLAIPLVSKLSFERTDDWGTAVLRVECVYALSRANWTVDLAILGPSET